MYFTYIYLEKIHFKSVSSRFSHALCFSLLYYSCSRSLFEQKVPSFPHENPHRCEATALNFDRICLRPVTRQGRNYLDKKR